MAQCLEHLVRTNRAMHRAMATAADPSQPRTLWQRLPAWPRLAGRMLISSQAPANRRKFTARGSGLPSASAIDQSVIERFADIGQDVISLVERLAGRDPAGIIMVSPFARFITYSLLDGLRLMVAHNDRHIAQAKRVMEAPGFPRT